MRAQAFTGSNTSLAQCTCGISPNRRVQNQTPDGSGPRNLKGVLEKLSNDLLVGGFNPFQKYLSKWESSPNRAEHKKYLSCHQPVFVEKCQSSWENSLVGKSYLQPRNNFTWDDLGLKIEHPTFGAAKKPSMKMSPTESNWWGHGNVSVSRKFFLVICNNYINHKLQKGTSNKGGL